MTPATLALTGGAPGPGYRMCAQQLSGPRGLCKAGMIQSKVELHTELCWIIECSDSTLLRRASRAVSLIVTSGSLVSLGSRRGISKLLCAEAVDVRTSQTGMGDDAAKNLPGRSCMHNLLIHAHVDRSWRLAQMRHKGDCPSHTGKPHLVHSTSQDISRGIRHAFR